MNNELVRGVSDALARCIAMNIERDVVAAELLPSERDVIARAVIPVVLERLREPTPAMLAAFVSRALRVSIDGEGGWSAYGRNQWQSMLDAAIRGLGE